MNNGVVILGGKGDTTWIVINYLRRRLPVAAAIIEERPSPWRLLRRRASKLGLGAVLGQALFLLYSKMMRMHASTRVAEISTECGMDDSVSPEVKVYQVDSANSEETIRLLQDINPSAVVVNGTRILTKEVLAATEAPFINTHCGITPKYRGVHGAYWAYAEGDAQNAGVTVHLVDPGIDTGGILYQARIGTMPVDNFCTYPYLQYAAALPALVSAVREVLEGRSLVRMTVALPSNLYFHPTLWGYIYRRCLYGVR